MDGLRHVVFGNNPFNWRLCLILCVLYFPFSNQVSWNLRTKPLVYGKNVTLFCSLPSGFSSHYQRKWKSGRTLLTLNEVPMDKTKYDGELEKTGFTLTIINFQVGDFDKSYTCIYGFQYYTSILNTKDYLWIPDINNAGVKFNSTVKTIDLQLRFKKVFPILKCVILIGQTSVQMENSSTTVVEKYFFDTEYKLKYRYKGFDCGENISVLCEIRSKYVPVAVITTPRSCAVVCMKFSPCQNGGTCEYGRSNITCNCTDSFIGENCTTRLVTSTMVATTTDVDYDCGLYIAIAVGVSVVVIAIGVITVRLLLAQRRQNNNQQDSNCTTKNDEVTRNFINHETNRSPESESFV